MDREAVRHQSGWRRRLGRGHDFRGDRDRACRNPRGARAKRPELSAPVVAGRAEPTVRPARASWRSSSDFPGRRRRAGPTDGDQDSHRIGISGESSAGRSTAHGSSVATKWASPYLRWRGRQSDRANMSSSRSGSPPKKSGDASHGEGKPGAAGPGETFDPTRMPDESRPDEGVIKAPRAAPAPGIPMSDEQYDWLKRKAKVDRTPSSKHRQEDPSAKRRK